MKSETGRECAVIFGDLPPATKLAQTARFNDPDDPCKFFFKPEEIFVIFNKDTTTKLQKLKQDNFR